MLTPRSTVFENSLYQEILDYPQAYDLISKISMLDLCRKSSVMTTAQKSTGDRTTHSTLCLYQRREVVRISVLQSMQSGGIVNVQTNGESIPLR